MTFFIWALYMYYVYISRLIVYDNKYIFLNIHSLCKHIKSSKQQTIKNMIIKIILLNEWDIHENKQIQI